MKSKITVKWVAESAIIAALYVALTWALAPISYGEIQFRIAEVLMLLVLVKPSYAFALILGCFIANTTSSLGWYDMVFGTLATAIAIIPMLKIKNIYISAIFPVISNAIIVAIELYLSLEITPIWLSMITVGLGEAVVLYLVGIPFILTIAKNDGLVEVLELDVSHIKTNSFFDKAKLLTITLSMVGVILFIAYPMYEVYEVIDEEVVVSTASAMSISSEIYPVLFAVLPVLYLVVGLFTKKNVRFILNVVISIALIVPFVLVGVNHSGATSYGYYYCYLVYLVLLLCASFYLFKKDKEVVSE